MLLKSMSSKPQIDNHNANTEAEKQAGSEQSLPNDEVGQNFLVDRSKNGCTAAVEIRREVKPESTTDQINFFDDENNLQVNGTSPPVPTEVRVCRKYYQVHFLCCFEPYSNCGYVGIHHCCYKRFIFVRKRV